MRESPQEVLEDTDLAGPLVFCLIFGGTLLLVSFSNFAANSFFAVFRLEIIFVSSVIKSKDDRINLNLESCTNLAWSITVSDWGSPAKAVLCELSGKC